MWAKGCKSQIYYLSLQSERNQKNQDMKKILMLIVVAVGISLPSQAQVKFGLKGGSRHFSALTGSGEVRSERWFEPDKYVF